MSLSPFVYIPTVVVEFPPINIGLRCTYVHSSAYNASATITQVVVCSGVRQS